MGLVRLLGDVDAVERDAAVHGVVEPLDEAHACQVAPVGTDGMRRTAHACYAVFPPDAGDPLHTRAVTHAAEQE